MALTPGSTAISTSSSTTNSTATTNTTVTTVTTVAESLHSQSTASPRASRWFADRATLLHWFTLNFRLRASARSRAFASYASPYGPDSFAGLSSSSLPLGAAASAAGSSFGNRIPAIYHDCYVELRFDGPTHGLLTRAVCSSARPGGVGGEIAYTLGNGPERDLAFNYVAAALCARPKLRPVLYAAPDAAASSAFASDRTILAARLATNVAVHVVPLVDTPLPVDALTAATRHPNSVLAACHVAHTMRQIDSCIHPRKLIYLSEEDAAAGPSVGGAGGGGISVSGVGRHLQNHYHHGRGGANDPALSDSSLLEGDHSPRSRIREQRFTILHPEDLFIISPSSPILKFVCLSASWVPHSATAAPPAAASKYSSPPRGGAARSKPRTSGTGRSAMAAPAKERAEGKAKSRKPSPSSAAPGSSSTSSPPHATRRRSNTTADVSSTPTAPKPKPRYALFELTNPAHRARLQAIRRDARDVVIKCYVHASHDPNLRGDVMNIYKLLIVLHTLFDDNLIDQNGLTFHKLIQRNACRWHWASSDAMTNELVRRSTVVGARNNVYLVGLTGEGKSTTFNMLLGLDPGEKGHSGNVGAAVGQQKSTTADIQEGFIHIEDVSAADRDRDGSEDDEGGGGDGQHGGDHAKLRAQSSTLSIGSAGQASTTWSQSSAAGGPDRSVNGGRGHPHKHSRNGHRHPHWDHNKNNPRRKKGGSSRRAWTIIDTPGLSDDSGNDRLFLANLMDVVAQNATANLVLLVKNKATRLDDAERQAIHKYNEMFGGRFWDMLRVVCTNVQVLQPAGKMVGGGKVGVEDVINMVTELFRENGVVTTDIRRRVFFVGDVGEIEIPGYGMVMPLRKGAPNPRQELERLRAEIFASAPRLTVSAGKLRDLLHDAKSFWQVGQNMVTITRHAERRVKLDILGGPTRDGRQCRDGEAVFVHSERGLVGIANRMLGTNFGEYDRTKVRLVFRATTGGMKQVLANVNSVGRIFQQVYVSEPTFLVAFVGKNSTMENRVRVVTEEFELIEKGQTLSMQQRRRVAVTVLGNAASREEMRAASVLCGTTHEACPQHWV